MTKPCLSASVVLSVTCHLTGQATLTVGAGGQFADLPQAVFAAQPGDRIVCTSTPPFQTFTAPMITRGVTIEGTGMHSMYGHLSVLNVPAGEQVVVSGFGWAGPVSARVWDCDGRVHLDQLWVGSAAGINFQTSISVLRSLAVSLHEVSTYGSPAVGVDQSSVTIDHCKFGRFAGGPFCGGSSVVAWNSVVTVAQPSDDVGDVPSHIENYAYFCVNSSLTITGKATQPGPGPGQILGAIVNGIPARTIEGINSTLNLSPDVLNTGPTVGFSSLPPQTHTPYHSASSFVPGFPVRLYTFDEDPAIGLAALSSPSLPYSTTLGTLWLDPTGFATYGFVLDANGEHFIDVPIPPTLPTGSTFTLQGATIRWIGTTHLSLPTTFSVRN